LHDLFCNWYFHCFSPFGNPFINGAGNFSKRLILLTFQVVLDTENIGKQSLEPEPKTLFALKRYYLPLSSPIAGDVQAQLARQPNDIAAIGAHFINVGISGAAAEDNTL
jgi:hypothetical protein